MPTWDKKKAHEWYEKNKGSIRLKKRRKYLESKRKVREDAKVSSKRS